MKINSFDDIIERIREDLRRGATSREIAKKYRLSLRDVQRIRRLEGFSISKYELLKQEAEELEAEIERKTKLKEELEQQILRLKNEKNFLEDQVKGLEEKFLTVRDNILRIASVNSLMLSSIKRQVEFFLYTLHTTCRREAGFKEEFAYRFVLNSPLDLESEVKDLAGKILKYMSQTWKNNYFSQLKTLKPVKF